MEMERMNVRENRPEVQEASLRIADYYQQHGVAGPELAQTTSTVLGSFVRSEAVAQGIQRGLQFLSLLSPASGCRWLYCSCCRQGMVPSPCPTPSFPITLKM